MHIRVHLFATRCTYAALLTSKDNLLSNGVALDYGRAQLRPNSLIRSAIDIEITINQRLRPKHRPGIEAIDQEKKVIIVSIIKRGQVVVDTGYLGEMRSTFDKAFVVKLLVPVYDHWAGISSDRGTEEDLAEIRVFLGGRDNDVEIGRLVSRLRWSRVCNDGYRLLLSVRAQDWILLSRSHRRNVMQQE